MTLLGIGGSLTLTATLTNAATGYAVRVQRTPTANPNVGVALEGGVLTGGGGVRPLPDGTASFAAGSSVTLTVTQAELSRVSRGDGPRFIVLLTQTPGGRRLDGSWRLDGTVRLGGGTSGVALSWPVTPDLTPPRFWARATRGPGNILLVFAATLESDAAFATVQYGGRTVTRPWDGTRTAERSQGFLFVLPREVTDPLVVTVTDHAGNASSRTVAPPPPRPAGSPKAPVRWNLPPWLPPDGPLGDILATFGAALPDAAQALAQLSPATASDAPLETHAGLRGVVRFPGEDDETLRARTLAVPRGHYGVRRGMEAHLSEIAGGTVTVRDPASALNAGTVRLDGSHRLDGSWTLGGEGADLPPGEYLVRLDEPLAVPVRLFLAELNRVRPAGTTPRVVSARAPKVPLFGELVGVREVNARPS